MKYIIVILVLISVELLYFKLARFYQIVDKPNKRSLHEKDTIRGGGVIFYLAVLLFTLINHSHDIYFIMGLTIASIISFWDDIYTLSYKYRLLSQFISILMLFGQYSEVYDNFLIVPVIVICIGVLNAYNFMDGINGITGIYSLIILISILYINTFEVVLVDVDFLIIMIISVVIFLFFNFRNKAICFGGDVGSIGIGYILIFLTIKLILQTNDYKYVFFFALYGLDTIYTIIYRIQLRQNIFEAHKLHFFQILVYKNNITHLQVSSMYALVQLLLNIWIITQSVMGYIFYMPFIIIGAVMHFWRKRVNLGINLN